MLFRPQRGALSEAMKAVVEFDGSLSGLVKVLDDSYKDDPVMSYRATESNVKVLAHTYDPRIDWDTYIVTVNEQAIGFTNGPLIS